MPQARALGRTAAGRTNRSLATPRRDDGCFTAGATVLGGEHQQQQQQQLAATLVHPAMSGTMLRPIAAGSMARLPRSTLSSGRRFPDADGFSHPTAPPARLHHVDGSAPARVSARPPPPTPPVARAGPHVRFAEDEPAAASESTVESHSESTFYPASTANFGDGAGVAGTRGQRWLPKNGERISDFLMNLHQNVANPSEVSAAPDASATGASPAELLSLALVSPRQRQNRIDLAFSNIRPETPRSAAPVNPRSVRQIVRAPPLSEQLDTAAHERDLRAVRGAIKKLGTAAGNLNQRTWFKGVPSLSGHGLLSADAFLRVLPKLNIDLTPAQEKLLVSLTFDGVPRADFLTLLPRLLGRDENVQSEIAPFLQYWEQLETPPAKLDPEPTALATLQNIKAQLDTRGLHSVLQAMGFSSRGNLTRARFAESVRGLSINLPPDEEARLLALLDPSNIDQIAPAQMFALADMPAHQLGKHHRVFKQLEKKVAHVSAAGGAVSVREECKEQVAPRRAVAGPSFGASLFDGIELSSLRTSSAPSSAPVEPLALSMVPPMFQSVHSARNAPIGRIGAPPESQTARVPPTRFQRTHAPLHTPMSSTGGIGRPLSANSHQLAQVARAEMKLPPLQTLPLGTLPLHRLADRAALDPSAGSANSTRNVFYSGADERFTPRDQALREMQALDKMGRSARLRAIGDRLDAAESRVLGSYEAHALDQHRREATSVVDKIQQKRGYFQALRDNYSVHESGKRVHQTAIDACVPAVQPPAQPATQ